MQAAHHIVQVSSGRLAPLVLQRVGDIIQVDPQRVELVQHPGGLSRILIEKVSALRRLPVERGCRRRG
jgi:hypothetical protein